MLNWYRYWACWIGAFGTEATAARILVSYWLPESWSESPGNAAILITVFNIIMVMIHICPVRVFGEIEVRIPKHSHRRQETDCVIQFWVSSLKVISVLGFLVVIWVIMGGGGPKGEPHGGEYWKDPGAVLNGFKGISGPCYSQPF